MSERLKRRGVSSLASAVFLVATMLFGVPSHAAEHGLGIYLLGTKGPLAGVVPGPGLYFQNDAYYYRAKAGAHAEIPMGGQVGIGIKARALIDVPTLIWAPKLKVLNGQLALSLSQPFGRESVDSDVVVGSQSGSFNGKIVTLGDPIATAMLGWKSGNFHWNTSAMVNIPVGHYRKDSMANLSFHRWAVDLSVAGTWLDPVRGWDVSGAIGVTFNGQNPATKYRSGRELHFEGAVSKYLTQNLSVGVVGYHYQQISNDTGAGAVLGGFRGRASALGPTIGYTAHINGTPVSFKLKVLKEFAVKNRLKGTAAFFSVSLPF